LCRNHRHGCFFSGCQYPRCAPDSVYEDDVRDAFLYARVLEQKTDLARRDRQFFLAVDHVCIYYAGLSHPKFGKLFGLNGAKSQNALARDLEICLAATAFFLFGYAVLSWYYLAFVS